MSSSCREPDSYPQRFCNSRAACVRLGAGIAKHVGAAVTIFNTVDVDTTLYRKIGRQRYGLYILQLKRIVCKGDLLKASRSSKGRGTVYEGSTAPGTRCRFVSQLDRVVV
eukprot:1189649-Prorocentrum_minimum.AAC.2